MIYPKLSDGTIDWCVMCKHEGRAIYDGCCECEYPENPDDPPAKYEPKPMTNGERIRRMTDDELADNFSLWCCRSTSDDSYCKSFGTCDKCWLGWLKQEASE